MPILRSGGDCSKPGMPRSSTNDSTLRSRGGVAPSSSLQMNTVVSACGPFVMNVFEPLSTNSSPSRTAEARMPPNASEPLSGSVIAHAPTLSRVSSGSAQRSRCSGVPFLIALPARFIDTPIAVTRPGQWRQNSTIGSSVSTARS